jgi:hypothetical protein
MNENKIIQGEFELEDINYISYKVGDIIPSCLSELKVAFVLESPYKEEINYSCPVAGGSGKAISKFMNSIDPRISSFLPFGRYLKQTQDNRFAILNCSNYPMDINAYPNIQSRMQNGVVAGGCMALDDIQHFNIPYDPYSLDKLRKAIQINPAVSKNSGLGETLKRLVTDFKSRLQLVLDTKAVIVVCGNIAKNFLILAGINLADENFEAVPHPSRNQWSQEKYREMMYALKKRFSEKLRIIS